MHTRSTTRTLNIGILAHVDAGKTSLTERLLYDTGAIDRLGSVDSGDTRTDTGEIERRRGITIRAAVASFTVGGTQVNLIDTPGHADFVAEVERTLGVLDAAVLVLSSVEGVQARTRVLMRTLRRLRLPTLLFLNKIDRPGARDAGLLADIRRRLVPHPVPLTRVRDALAARTVDGSAHPVCHGSALSGEGVGPLVQALIRLFPAAAPPDGGAGAGSRATAAEPRGTVFAVRPEGAYLRLYEGEVAPRQRLTFLRREADGRTRGCAAALVRGGVRRIVRDRHRGCACQPCSPKLFEQGVPPGADLPSAERDVPRKGRGELRDRLSRARRLRRTGRGSPCPARSAGRPQAQKQVLAATLAAEYGIEADFAPSRTVCVERPVGTGEAYEEIRGRDHTGLWATVGLRVEPGERGSGPVFGYETELGALPRAFHQAIEDTVCTALREGPHGWAVTDCRVTLIRSGFASPVSTAGDFRGVTSRVLARALERAGTRVHEPCHMFEARVPLDALAPVASCLAGLEAELGDTSGGDGSWLLAGSIPARRVPEAERRLPGLTRGEGEWWSQVSGD
ncbi:GTP-binding protein, partial [Streptomyces boncukensis]